MPHPLTSLYFRIVASCTCSLYLHFCLKEQDSQLVINGIVIVILGMLASVIYSMQQRLGLSCSVDTLAMTVHALQYKC